MSHTVVSSKPRPLRVSDGVASLVVDDPAWLAETLGWAQANSRPAQPPSAKIVATDGIANRNRRGLDDRPRDAGAAGGVWHVMGGADIIRQALAARLVDELSNPDEP